MVQSLIPMWHVHNQDLSISQATHSSNTKLYHHAQENFHPSDFWASTVFSVIGGEVEPTLVSTLLPGKKMVDVRGQQEKDTELRAQGKLEGNI